MTSHYDDPAETDIAIIGMAGRFPGADSPDELWKKIAAGEELISFFSDDELLNSGVDKRVLREPGYVNASPVLKDPSRFDALFFGYSPREAATMDPQQRLFLECAAAALERAGYDPDRYEGPIGVFASEAMNTYLLQGAVTNRFFEEYLPTLLTNDKDFLATRVSYKLNLTGPSMTIQTACSSSLVCVHTACQSLLSEECDMALAGGVSVRVPHVTGYLYQPGSVFSPDGHCRPFDAKAQGTIFGSGAGVVVLKRLSDAIADGDTVWAVIKGSAINNDGASKSDYTAPSVRQQARCVIEAHAIAGIEPETISYIEAHGTGTYLGDPIEVAALSMAFREGTAQNQFCALGSLKSNIGHLDAAAGVAGLIKTAYALKNRIIPPTINFDTPNPEIDFAASPFRVADKLEPWVSPTGPRRAGVQSLGMGGTNAHVILEEAPPVAESAHPDHPRFYLVSAKTSEACREAAANLADALEADPDLDLGDVAFTLDQGRRKFAFRRAVAAGSRADLIEGLKAPGRPVRVSSDAPSPGFMFSGQGAQYPGMGRGLYETEAVFRAAFDDCRTAFARHVDIDLARLVFPTASDEEAAAEQLRQTIYTQPALFAVEYALARLWMGWGVTPQWMIGHSIGEYAAACIAGVFDLDAAAEIVATRARLMYSCDAGAMLAVSRTADETRALLTSDLDVAVINTATSTVVSGPTDAIDALAQRLAGERIPATRLQTSHAFHSQMMAPILEEFEHVVARHTLAPPAIAFISNVSGDWITDEQATSPRYWADHIRKPVRFADGLSTLFEDGPRAFIEVGPGRTLATFVGQHASATADTAVLSSLRHPRQHTDDGAFIREAAANLWAAGIDLAKELIARPEEGRRVPLPTYPFARTSHWVKQAPPAVEPAASLPAPPPLVGDTAALMQRLAASGRLTAEQLAGAPAVLDALAAIDGPAPADPADWCYDLHWRPAPEPLDLKAWTGIGTATKAGGRWLVFADERGIAARWTDVLAGYGVECVTVSRSNTFRALGDGYQINPQSAGDIEALLRDVAADPAAPLTGVLYAWGLDVPDARGSAVDPARLNTAGANACLILARLVVGLSQADVAAPLMVVTQAAIPANPGVELPGLAAASLWGIAPSLAAEYASLNIRLLDLPDDVDTGALHAAASVALASDDRERFNALRNGRRLIARLERRAPNHDATAASFPVSGEATYLITGGFGYLGRRLAAWLVERGARRIALAGRNGADETARVFVDDLEKAGATILSLTIDITDAAALGAALDQIATPDAPLRGVIHAAGVAGFARPGDLTASELERVLAPKLIGTWNLDQATRGAPLDWFIAVSSVGAVWGGRGQGPYDAANRVLDSLMHQRRGAGLPALSVNFGPFPKGSMGDDKLHEMLERIGLKSLDPHPAFDAMAALYEAGEVQATVARVDWATFRPFLESHGPDPLLEGIPTSGGAAAPGQATKAAPEGSGIAPDSVQTYLRTRVADALGYAPDQIEVDQSLVSLGLDSLRAVTLRSDILMDHDVDVAIEDLIGDCTIMTLTALLEKNGVARAPSPPSASSSAPAHVEPAAPAAAGTVPASANATAPVDDIQAYLRGQVADTLGYAPDEIDPDQPLVALGLDSLRAVTIQSNIVTHLGVAITVENLVGDGSIASLTALIQKEMSAAAGAAPDQDAAGDFDMVEGEL